MNALHRIFRASLALVACLISMNGEAAALPASIEVVTETQPPFQYVENGEVSGLTVEIVKAVLDDAKITGKFQALPWARALRVAESGERVLIFPLVRSPDREAHFKWIGTITSTRDFIYALKDHVPNLTRLDDARNYVTGTVIGDVEEEYFLRHGFVQGKTIVSVSSHELNYRKLKAQRISLWPVNEVAMAFIVREAGDDPASLMPVWQIRDLSPYPGNFMAFGPNTPDELVEALRRSLARVKADGRFEGIQRKWMR